MGKSTPKRENFASQIGLVLAAVGSAVGLGNIWRFSYILGVNGGGAFLLVYILCVVLVGIPLLIAELTIGRSSALSTVSAFKKLAPKSHWWITGVLAVIAPTIIMAYYPVIAGWSLGYVVESLVHWPAMQVDTKLFFEGFAGSYKAFAYGAVALAATTVVLWFGVAGGIEKSNKVLMPTLALLLVVLVIRSCTLPGAGEGIRFLFVPKFSELRVTGILAALGHSFFTLSLGMGIMITYGSYMSRDANLPAASVSIIALDTAIALLAGLAIFPAVFALGMAPDQGPELAFVTLPATFALMPLGRVFSALFFLLIFIAALTSMMSLMQVPLAWMEDELGMSRKKGLLIIAAVLAVLGIPSVLSSGALSDFLIFEHTYFNLMDKLANDILLPLTGLCTALFVIFRWGVAKSKEEFLAGNPRGSHFLATIYPFAITFIAPVAIILILLNATGVFSRLFGD